MIPFGKDTREEPQLDSRSSGSECIPPVRNRLKNPCNRRRKPSHILWLVSPFP